MNFFGSMPALSIMLEEDSLDTGRPGLLAYFQSPFWITMTTCLVQRYILHLSPVPLSSAPHPSSETISHTNEPLKPYGEWMIVKSKKPSKPSRPTITPADQKASSANHVPKPQHMPIPQHVSTHVIHPPYPLHHVTEHLKMLPSLSILGRIQHPLITIYPLISMQNHLSLQQT